MKGMAVVKVGSHEMSLTIANLKKGVRPILLEKVSRTIHSSETTYRQGEITPQVISQMIEILEQFKVTLEPYQPLTLRAVGTAAFREAKNYLYALDQIEQETGIKLQILSPTEDWGYQLLSVVENTAEFQKMCQEKLLLLGMGSDSIQLANYDDGELCSFQSLPLGSLRLKALLSELAETSTDYSQLLLEYISGDLDYYQQFEPRVSKAKHLIIYGSELRLFRRLMQVPEQGEVHISLSTFEEALKKMTHTTPQILAKEMNLSVEESALLLPVVLLVKVIFHYTGREEVILPQADLAEGLILAEASQQSQYILKREVRQDQLSLIKRLAQRFGYDQEHSRYVARWATELFDQTRKIHRLPKSYRQLLQEAALLHNIGKSISMSQDDLRSYDLVSSFEIPGRGELESTLCSLLVYYHNGNLDMEPDLGQSLPPEQKLILAKLSSLLSLANALDASHQQKITGCTCRLKNSKTLVFSLESAETIALELWTLNRHSQLFHQVTGYQIEWKLKGIRRGS